MNASELKSRQDYWVQVRECLIRFHGFSQRRADDEVIRLLGRLPVDSADPSVDLVYHVEPFRLACNVSGKRLSLREYASQYSELLDETAFWSKSGVDAPKMYHHILSILKGYLEQDVGDSSQIKRVKERNREYSSSAKEPKQKELKPVASSERKRISSPKKKTNPKKNNKPVL